MTYIQILKCKKNTTMWEKKSTFLLLDTSVTVRFDDTFNLLEQLGNIHMGSTASPPHYSYLKVKLVLF